MVYKKYIKRDGKIFGPYYYESYRKNGRVKTKFIRGPKKKDKIINKIKSKKHLIKLFLVLFIIVFLLSLTVLLALGLGVTGNIVGIRRVIEND